MSELKCNKCGATANHRGDLWDEAGLRVHKSRWCRATLDKGKAAKKAKVKAELPGAPALSFCPCCGLNLQVLQAALSIAQGL